MNPTFILPTALYPLKDYLNFVVWNYQQEKGEWKKPPITPRHPYKRARTNDPATWGSFDEAMQALSLGSFQGPGFNILGSSKLVFDLDDCRNRETGVVLPEAWSIVHRARSYTEISPSGTGLKIFGTGSGDYVHRNDKIPNSTMIVESYRNCERYTTVTGNVLPGTEQYQLADLDAFMDALVSYLDRAAAMFESAPLWVKEALYFDKKGERSEEFFRIVTYLHEQGWSIDDIGMLLSKTPLAAKYETEGKNRLRKEIERAISKSNPQGGASQTGQLHFQLEFAMADDPEKLQFEYLEKPFLPAKCVVGFYGRGSSSKTSFLTSIAAHISRRASTLWISCEEPTAWIKARFIKSGGTERTLITTQAIAKARDAQDRVIASSFNVFDHVEPLILRTQAECEKQGLPLLRLIVLDTVVGLTTWAKGETPNSDASVKKLIAFLQGLAEEHNLTIAIIGHANKGKHEHFSDEVMGARAWVDVPRLSFQHTVDFREQYAFVIRTSKTNFFQFAMSYTTEVVHVLDFDADGFHTALVCAVPGQIVMGARKAEELWEAAITKPVVGDLDMIQIKETLARMVRERTTPVTREEVQRALGRNIDGRVWLKIDNQLDYHPHIMTKRGDKNTVLYTKRDNPQGGDAGKRDGG